MNGPADNQHEDDRLRWQLRGLRRDIPPTRDLWPDIAARIAAGASDAGHAHPVRRARLVPWALAASLLVATGLIWQMQRLQPRTAQLPDGQNTLIAHEEQAMTREYRGALHELTASVPTAGGADPTLHELDRSAAQIRSALARDPDARFLLDRLRHTYSLRLALTQRAVLT
jgi:hypothetical protein